MPSLEQRLEECFATVFPDLARSEIANASLDNTAQWDSLATVILVTVLEEEFAVVIDPNDFPRLASFGSILAYLESQTANRAGVQES